MKTSLKQTTIVTIACLAVLAGLVLGRHLTVSAGWLLGGLALIASVWRTRWRPLAVILLFGLFGLWRAGQVAQHDQRLADQMGQKVSLIGTVKDDPSVSDTNQLGFTLAVDHMNGQPYATTISVYTFRMPLHRGYRVAVAGKPKPARGASQASVSFPAVQILSDHLSWLEQLRLRFFAAERAAIPEPMASFALGLLIGARALIPKTLQGQLSAVGLSHLVAVSGYNLTILVNGVRGLFKRSGKFFVLGLSLWLIAIFVALAGASASIVRAAWVSVLVLLAGYYGRSIRPAVLIALAAAITAMANPHSLWSDLGWQLSFAAFLGILLLAPELSKRFGGERHAGIALIFEALSAYIVTLPLILHSFGTLAWIAPLINVLVMPLVPLAMLLSFIAGLSALVVPLIAGWISWPATIMLRFMVGLIQLTARVAPASVYVSTSFMVIWYGLIALLLVIAHRRPDPNPNWYNINEEEADVRTLKVA